jgi:hypothetical protein
MRNFRLLILVFFSLIYLSISAQQVIKQVADITGSDTCCVSTYIGEIYYFGKNSKKARFYPHYSCFKGDISCEILWVPSKSWKKRSKITEEQFKDYVFGLKESKFENYPCFAFFQKYKLNKLEDGIIYEPVFPVLIEVCFFENNKWEKLFERQVETNKELGDLQLELVR